MAKPPAFFPLLEADDNPTQRSWNEIVNRVSRDPKSISVLIDDSFRDDFLIHLTTYSHRLARFFYHLRSFARRNAKSAATINIAAETVALLIGILPDIHQRLDPKNILAFRILSRDLCFVSNPCLNLRKLRLVLTTAGSLVEYIPSNRQGIELIRSWIAMLPRIALDVEAVNQWTERLLDMMQSCNIYGKPVQR